MPDAMDIKEALGARPIKAPTPPTGATKAERLQEALVHVAAAGAGTGPTLIRDPKFGHTVEVHTLPPRAPGLEGGPPGAVLTAKEDPGNIRVREGHTVESGRKAGAPPRRGGR